MELVLSCHPDDCLIGTFRVLKTRESIEVVVFSKLSKTDLQEMNSLVTNFHNIENAYECNGSLQKLEKVFRNIQAKIEVVYTPSLSDYHPLHKLITKFVEINQEKYGYEIIYYSTCMNMEHLQELSKEDQVEKKGLLNKIFPSQSDLWKYDWRYFLFEGYHKAVKI